MKKQLNKKELKTTSGGVNPTERMKEINDAINIIRKFNKNHKSVKYKDYERAIDILAKYRLLGY